MYTTQPFFLRPFVKLGAQCLAFIGEMGAMALFLLHAMTHMFSSVKQIPKVVRQVYVIGAESLLLIVLISLFTGMVLGLQGYYTLTQFGSEGMLGSAVALTLIRELGPVLTAIMITGRAGSAMTAGYSKELAQPNPCKNTSFGSVPGNS